ncbi:MAG: 2-amino-4-hydroxy-6-hydroxymethyldihydropteridine diphosphokinase [Bacteroidales bacterium]|nr:2-amino-4-hydroxy-6-hydroxymethyldihydropteridine diphosphokinase [Bacteroidales bacterium]MDP2237631.1 2-amino-4-hydroxy-6-hydroxymethyldihydropteridine diphosphokinase [Bacteroidales bacterium]
MMEMDVCILLGSNLGNREEQMELATAEILRLCGELLTKSSIYETMPWGFEDECDFLNQVIVIKTSLSPANLLHQLLEIETSLGRKRTSSNGYISRNIDIDILYYGSLVLETEKLSIPHPRLHLRRFTLVPLFEIVPDFIHPVLQKSHSELLQTLDDSSAVKLYAKSFSI